VFESISTPSVVQNYFYISIGIFLIFRTSRPTGRRVEYDTGPWNWTKRTTW